MNIIIISFVLLAVFAILAMGIYFLLQRETSKSRENLNQILENNAKSFREEMGLLNKSVNERLRDQADVLLRTNQNLGQRLDHASDIVSKVNGKLMQFEEFSRRFYELGKDISGLQEILRAPKLRGSLGELLLDQLLGQILPSKSFTLQYMFKSGEKVDAVISLGDKLVPIDAKFPYENFKKFVNIENEIDQKQYRKIFVSDVKKHIDSIATKYILPDEKTFDFAMMYIPAENVYYETIIKDENFGDEKSIAAYALSKKVIPVSPNSFYAYLQAILLGLKGLTVEAHAQDILKTLATLQREFKKFRVNFSKVGSHLNNAKSAYEKADKRLEKFDAKLLSTDDHREKEVQDLTLIDPNNKSVNQDERSENYVKTN